MKKKKKVLFYGNCQASGLAKILSLHESFLDKYEIIQKGKLPGHLSKTHQSIAHHKIKIFGKPLYQEKWKIVEEKLKQTDILIHHGLSGEREVCMNYVYQNFPNIEKFIKVPSHYFTGYLYGGGLGKKRGFIQDAIIHCKYDPQKTVKLLQNDYMPKWGEWVQEVVKINYDSMMERTVKPDYLEKERFLHLESADYVKNNFRSKFMNYNTVHPTHFVFDHWLKQICDHLKVERFVFEKPMAGCIAGPCETIWPGHFKFFKSDIFDDSLIDGIMSIKWKWSNTLPQKRFEKRIKEWCEGLNPSIETSKEEKK